MKTTSATSSSLVAAEDTNGSYQRFVYHLGPGLLQYVIDNNGRVLSLNFGNGGGNDWQEI